MVVFSLVFWTWAGAEGEFMRKPASQWSQRDVTEWLDGLGTWATKNYSDLFQQEVGTNSETLDMKDIRAHARTHTHTHTAYQRATAATFGRGFPEGNWNQRQLPSAVHSVWDPGTEVGRVQRSKELLRI